MTSLTPISLPMCACYLKKSLLLDYLLESTLGLLLALLVSEALKNKDVPGHTTETQKLKKNQKGEERGPQVQADQELSLKDHEEITLWGEPGHPCWACSPTHVYEADHVPERGPHALLGYPALAGGEATVLHSSDFQGKITGAPAGTTLGVRGRGVRNGR